MRLIISSYLKTFIKHWASILGILLFIVMLGAIVLGMMSTPLQLNNQIHRIRRQSEIYNWELQNLNGTYNKDFTYHYLLLNGDKYGGQILKTDPEALPIAPKSLRTFLDKLRDPNDLSFNTYKTFFSRSTYLILDSLMSEMNINWTELLAPPANKNFDDNDRIDCSIYLAKLINNLVYQGQISAAVTLTSEQNPWLGSKGEDFKKNYIEIFVNDLKANLDADWVGETAFADSTNAQQARQLFLINAFLKANQIEETLDEVDYEKVKTLLNENQNLKTLSTIGVSFFTSQFRTQLWTQHLNNLNSFLWTQIFMNPENTGAWTRGKPNFALDTAIQYSLSRILPGSWTPEFSTDVRSAEGTSSFNKPLLQSGKEPQWILGQKREILLNASFLKSNNLTVGSSLILPPVSFGNNILSNEDPESWEVSHERPFQIVGTALKYDELTPGENFTSFVQSFETYTYSYLPSNYLQAYLRASFLYSSSLQQGSMNVGLRSKNLQQKNLNPTRATEINNLQSETIFVDPSTVIIPFNKISTISKLSNIKIQVIIYTILGLISLLLAFIFINFVIKKEINETRRQLGIFKSFGYQTSELSLIFAIKTLITIALGLVLGWLCSFPLQMFLATNFENNVMFTFQKIYFNSGLILGIFLIIPGLFMLVSYLITLRYLSEPVLALINNQSPKKFKKPQVGLISKLLQQHQKGFDYRLSQSFIKSSKGKFIVIQILFAFSALIYTLMFGAQAIIYQAIEQGFSLLKKDTDHEYQWTNRSSLIITPKTNDQFALSDPNLENYEKQGLKYLDYEGFENPNYAMLAPEQAQKFTMARYRFRVLTDALANSVVQRSDSPANPDQWVLFPTAVALNFFANKPLNPNQILNLPYFLSRLLTFKALADPKPTAPNPMEDAIEKMATNNQSFSDNLDEIKTWNANWMTISDLSEIAIGSPFGKTLLKTTFLGLTAQSNDGNSDQAFNNFFLTDLSRIFSLLFANQYIVQQMQLRLEKKAPNFKARFYPEKIVEEVLNELYQESLISVNSPLFNYDPRNPLYWGMTKNPLLSNFKQQALSMPDGSEIGIIDLIDNLEPTLLELLTSAMLSRSKRTLNAEPVVNFNRFYFNKAKAHLQLLLKIIPQNPDLGTTSLTLIDVQNQEFGNPKNEYNFEGVTSSQYQQLTIKPPGKNVFNGIIPYAVARKLHLEIGDVLDFYTPTQSRIPIKINVVGINRSLTIPLGFSWLIMVDYQTFAEELFSQALKTAIGFKQPAKMSAYYFNDLISQTPMLGGSFNLLKVDKSLDSLEFKGSQLVVNIAPDANLFASLFKVILPKLLPNNLAVLDPIKILNFDSQMTLVTNPMMIGKESKKVIAFPYNIARDGLNHFASTTSQMMVIFLILQSILLTITLCVVMNIIVDEAAIIILTLRSLGYLPREINWIIMGPYVIGIIISLILAYVLSNIIWKVFLIVAQKNWDLIIFFPFDWQGLVIPILVLGTIMFFGWVASNYQVNRRPLSQITNFS